jgi:hypothetical protein
MRVGACATAENAAIAAYVHLIRGDTNAAQVVRPDGEDAYRQFWTSSGITTWVNPHERPRTKLRRVK